MKKIHVSTVINGVTYSTTASFSESVVAMKTEAELIKMATDSLIKRIKEEVKP